MFVRWKRRRMRGAWACSWQRRTGGPVFVRYAVLVESAREAGKVRQRFIAHLAHIPEPLMSMALHRGLFWRDVNRRLAELQVDESTAAKARASLLAVVPLTDKAQEAAERSQLARLERSAGRSA